MNEDVRTSIILCSLLTIADASLPVKSKDVQNALNELITAARYGEWGSIAKAAKALTPPSTKSNSDAPKSLNRYNSDILKLTLRGTAFEIYMNPGSYDLPSDRKPSKADILSVIELRYPQLYYLIPTSKRGLTNWWKQVERNGSEIPQARGNASPEANRIIRASGQV